MQCRGGSFKAIDPHGAGDLGQGTRGPKPGNPDFEHKDKERKMVNL